MKRISRNTEIVLVIMAIPVLIFLGIIGLQLKYDFLKWIGIIS